MTAAGDPPFGAKGDYVVPLPRRTDALGLALRRAYRPPVGAGPLTALLQQLDGRR